MSQKHRTSKNQARGNKIKEELSLNRDAFKQLFEILPDAVVVTNTLGIILYANSQAERMFGYQLEELEGKPVEILIPARFDVHNKQRETYHARPHMRPMGGNLELFALRKEGVEFPVEIALSPLETAEGQIFIAIIRDITPRRLADQDLKRSEARNRALLAAIPDLMIRVHRDGTIWDYHVEDPGNLHIPARSLLGSKLSETFPPNVAQQALDAIEKVVETGKRQSFEYSLSVPDGLRHFDSRVTPGNSDEFILVIRDITRLKQVEERYRVTLDNMLEGCQIIGFDWRYLYVNEAAARQGFTKPEDLLRHTMMEAYPGIEDTELFQVLRRCMEARLPDSIENEFAFQDGTTGWFEVRIQPVPEGLFILSMDITERKKAKDILEQSEKRFRSLIENSADAITLLDANGVTVYDSPAAPGMLGYGSDELIGQNMFAIVHPDDLTLIQPLFQELTQSPGARTDIIFRVRHKNGSWRWIEAVATNLLEEPAVQAIVANYRDITERVQAEIALRESDERFRNLFENSPVSIWEEDFSQVKAYLDKLKDVLGEDFESYLTAHPEVISECASLVRIIDVNRAAMEFYGATHKTTLLENLSNIFMPESLDTFRQEMFAIWKGARRLEVDRIARTLTGLRRDVNIIWAVVPGHEETYSRVLVSEIDITERRQAAEEIQSRTDELATLYELSRALAEANNLDEVLGLVNQRTVASVLISFARIALLEGDQLVMQSAYPIRVLDHELFVGNRYALTAAPKSLDVLEKDEPVILLRDNPDLSVEERAVLLLDFAQSVCLIPLRAHDFASNSSRPLGLLMLAEARNEEREPFTPEKLRLARSIGDQAAIAIENTRLFNDLQRSNSDLVRAYDATITGWSAAMDLRDKETEGHTRRVTEMTVRLAKQMGFSQQELVQVRRGALLHDIGKMGVPDRILLKPDKLTDEEWVVMRMHPVYAYEFLEPINYLVPALDIPYCHHEKWNGGGYPRGLKGEEIPLAARIFAVVDVYDALTSDRPYREAWPKEKTLKHIQSLSGSHFDPQVVEVFQAFLREE